MKWQNIASLLIGITIFASAAYANREDRVLKPESTVDLRTRSGAELVQAQWRYSDARIVEVDHRAVGPDLKPSGAASRTHDVTPQAGAAGFDDSAWEIVAPEMLEQRRSTGKLSFAWYRTKLTVPQTIGALNVAGSTAVFEIVADDYAEVWVNGKLPQVLGETGGQTIRGWNAPNRVVLTRQAKPGETFELAIFAANGPLSQPPGNFIWIRSATLDFYRPGALQTGEQVTTEIERVDPALDAIVARGTKAEKVADGFGFTEGPVWVKGDAQADGYLLFSDPNNNTIYRLNSDGHVSIFRTHSGYTGSDIGEYSQPGSNGLALDPQGRLTICEHGNHRISRLETNGVLTVLADNYQGKRLNSPNDLVYRADGALFFTDPPYGLPKFFDDPRKALKFSGVYCIKDGKLSLVSTDFTGPNGLAFSPDEKYLFVTNWNENKKVVMRYEVAGDGSLSNGVVFFDRTSVKGEQALDGLKIDRAGNLYLSGPAGLWIISPQGKHLGTIKLPELPANFAWGDADGRTLYVTARTSVYRIRLNIAGAGHEPPAVVQSR